MKRHAVALVSCFVALPALADDNPFAGMKGKMKEGMWQYTMEMGSIPGMPQGMKMPPMNFSRCLTAQDIEKGGATQKEGKVPENCTVKNMKMSGNNASYTMECTKDPKMKSDVKMTFQGDSFTMHQDIEMDRGGQMMKMTQTMTGKYTGPCK
ncbi:MAG TPA: DUF3617 family protein [Usitatibacter sp.]|jgi:hypothetical protein|nr:DUF3617 family protein [Usitatibacter sp.]